MWAIARRWRVISAVSALVIATCLVVVAMFSVALSLRVLNESFGWVRHTDGVLLQVAKIETDLVAAESAERGYLLTSNPQYAANFEDDRIALSGEFATLGELVSDNPAQVQRLDDLRQTAEARLQQLKGIIAIGPQNLDTAIAAVRAAAPQRLTEVVREKLDGFREAENSLRQQREEKTGRDMTRTIIFSIGATVLALLSGSTGLVMLQRERERSRQRELQLELAHMARLNTMGETAAMLAHELNQPLTAANNYLSAVQALTQAAASPASDRVIDIVGRATAQLERAGDILRRLRGFVQKSEPTKSLEDPSTLFEDAITLLGMRSDGLKMTTSVAPNLGQVIIDKVEIQQVLINLMRNAVEAMSGGARQELGLSAVAADDHYVQVSVKDTGPGLAAEIAERLFQPFVSTKTSGMGVGLSICRTIITRNGGRIWSDPNPEGDTVFSFTLPRASAQPDALEARIEA